MTENSVGSHLRFQKDKNRRTLPPDNWVVLSYRKGTEVGIIMYPDTYRGKEKIYVDPTGWSIVINRIHLGVGIRTESNIRRNKENDEAIINIVFIRRKFYDWNKEEFFNIQNLFYIHIRKF